MPETRITITECCGCGARHEERQSSADWTSPHDLPVSTISPRRAPMMAAALSRVRGMQAPSRPAGWVGLHALLGPSEVEYLCPACCEQLPLKAREAIKRMLAANSEFLAGTFGA